MLRSTSVSGGGTKGFFVEKFRGSLIFTCEYLQNISYSEPRLGNSRNEIFEVLQTVSGGERQGIPESLNSSSFLLVDLN